MNRALPSTVVVTSRSFSSGNLDVVADLQARGLQVVRAATDHNLADMEQALSSAIGWIAGTAPVTAEHLALAPHLRVLARYGVGVDAVDLQAARLAGIIVANTPGANSDAVAEHAVGLLLATLRSIPAGDARVRAGTWTVTRGRQLASTCAGVVGFGRIGRGVTARLRGLGCRALVHDPYVPAEIIAAEGAQPATLEEIQQQADVVSLHAPGGRTIVDAGWVARAKPGQTIVNTARGDLIDEDAVAAGLRSGVIFAYAADTLAHEDGSTPSVLLAPDLAERVVITPHLGAQTVEAVDSMGSMAVEAVLDVIEGRVPRHLVSAPQKDSA